MASTTTRPPAQVRARRGRPEEPEADQTTIVEPYRLTPKLARRVALLSALVVIGFAALLMRLWALQVLSGSHYAAKAKANQVRTVPVEAPRGTILDQHGHVLVTNEPVTSVELAPSGLARNLATPGGRDSRAGTRRRGLGPSHHEAARRAPNRRRHARPGRRPHPGDGADADVPRGASRATSPGLVLARSYIRRYPHGSVAAQLLGYDGQNTALRRRGDRPDRNRGGVRPVPARRSRRGPRPGRLARSAPQPAPADDPADDGPNRATHDRRRLQVAAQNALQYGIQRRSTRVSGRPTAARSSRSTRRTDRFSRSPPRRRTTRRSTAGASPIAPSPLRG